MDRLTAVRFKDMIELLYPDNNTIAVLPHSNGKEEIIIKGIYKTIREKIDENCQFTKQTVKLNYGECR